MARRIRKKATTQLFQDMLGGKKTFDIRSEEFDVREGDELILDEWDDVRKEYTGRSMEARVTFVEKTKDYHFWRSDEALRCGFQVTQLEFNEKLPRGVEVICSVVVRNDEGEVLLVRSSRWSDKWTLPGGQLRPGEPMFSAAARAVREQTGLVVLPLAKFGAGELIRSLDYHRAAHFLHLDIVGDTVAGELDLDEEQVDEARWFALPEALKADLAAPHREVLHAYKRWIKHQASCSLPSEPKDLHV